MIRTLMAVVLAVLIVGFVWSYAFFTQQIKPVPTQVAEWDADGSYDINVVSTFDVQGNFSSKISFNFIILVNKFSDF